MTSSTAYIDELLDKYWEGESSLEEERLLKAYFSGQTIADHHRPLVPLFAAIKAEQTVQLTTTGRLVPVTHTLGRRYQWAAAAAVALMLSAGTWTYFTLNKRNPTPTAAVLPLPEARIESVLPEQPPQIAFAPKTVSAKKTVRCIKTSVRTKPKLDPETEKAVEEIKAALALVSRKLRKGQEKASEGTRKIEEVEQVLNKIRDDQG